MRLVLYFVFVFLALIKHSGLYANFSFGKISAEEMNLEKWLEKYPDQPAVVIGDIGEVWFEFTSKGQPQYLLKRTFRMIILKPEGMDYGNFPIPFYETRRGGKEEVTKINGNVFNLDYNRVKRTRVRQRDGYTNDLGNNWKEMIIPFPEIKVGSVFEIEYQVRSDYIHELSYWHVQREIPVVFNRFVFRMPGFFSYMLYLTNKNIIERVDTKEVRERFTIARKPTVGVRPNITSFTVDATQFTWEAQDVPPMLPEPYTDNINNYRAGISLELIRIEYPDAEPILYSQTLESVRDFMFKHEDFGQFLINSRRAIISNFDFEGSGKIDEDLSKATRIIRERIKWNQKPGKFATGTPDEILTMGSGNSADVNLMLCALIRQMGYNAQPLLLSTVNSGRLISDSPTISKLNYVIVAVEGDEGNWILIDATATGLPPGYLPRRALNGRGKLLLPHKPIWIDLKNKNDRDINKEYIVNLGNDGSIEASFKYEYGGYSKHIEKSDIQSKSSHNTLSSIANKFGIEEELIKVENLDDTENPLILSGSFQMDNVGIEAADELILPLLLFETLTSHPFQLEERAFPVNFFTTFSEKVKMRIVIPEGFAISHRPRSQSIRGVGGFLYSLDVKEIEGALEISTIFTSRNSAVSVQNYLLFKTFHDRIINLHSEKTVLYRN
jgi:hypothetical protein